MKPRWILYSALINRRQVSPTSRATQTRDANFAFSPLATFPSSPSNTVSRPEASRNQGQNPPCAWFQSKQRIASPGTRQPPHNDYHHRARNPEDTTTRNMPPRKSTSSVTPADADDSLQLSPQTQTEKPVTATEQQLKARAEAGVSVEVSRKTTAS